MEQTPKPSDTAKPKSGKTMYAAVGAVVIIIVVVLALYFAGVLTPNNTPGTPAKIFDTGSCSSATNCDFSPVPVSISTGGKVTWTSNSTTPHTVTACSTANSPDSTSCPTMNASSLPSFDSGSSGITNGQSYSNTFSTAGTYYYYCRFHNWMHGQVNVS